jgi:hypothetical protein
MLDNWPHLTTRRERLRFRLMAVSGRLTRQLIVPGGLLLLAACGRHSAYDRIIQEQHAQASANAEAKRMAEEEVLAMAEAQRAQREQAELALESDPPSVLSEEQLHQVLGYYCGDCHFSSPCSTCERARIYLDDVKQMISHDTVIPGNAEGSPVVQQMREHRVPLPDGIPPASAAAITLVADFIDQLPAPATESADSR